MNQTFTLNEQLVSELTADFTDLANILTKDLEESPKLELSSNTERASDSETDSIQLASVDLFSDSEVESPLYSSMAIAEDNEAEPVVFPEPMDEPIAEAPLTNTITVGNEGGTQFTFNFAEDTPQEVIDGVAQAGENWASVLKDDVNVNIDFNFAPDDSGFLGFTLSNYLPASYTGVKQALAADVTSINDDTAIANLPESNIDVLINNTSENDGSDAPYLDDNNGFNNSNVLLTRANAKALGIGLEALAEDAGITTEEVAEIFNQQYPDYPVDANAADASITLSSNINWDFDPSDGIADDAIDFIGVATHEIGHALGFESSADVLDFIANPSFDLKDIINSIPSEEIQELIADTSAEFIADLVAIDRFISENEYLLEPFDLYRFTPESLEQGAIDFTAGNIEDKYFSIDGGQTEIAPLSEGTSTGDGQQFSHWEDNLNIGIMDPTGEFGESLEITDTDLIAFDVIGWDVA